MKSNAQGNQEAANIKIETVQYAHYSFQANEASQGGNDVEAQVLFLCCCCHYTTQIAFQGNSDYTVHYFYGGKSWNKIA